MCPHASIKTFLPEYASGACNKNRDGCQASTMQLPPATWTDILGLKSSDRPLGELFVDQQPLRYINHPVRLEGLHDLNVLVPKRMLYICACFSEVLARVACTCCVLSSCALGAFVFPPFLRLRWWSSSG